MKLYLDDFWVTTMKTGWERRKKILIRISISSHLKTEKLLIPEHREKMKSQKWKRKNEIEAPQASENVSYFFFHFSSFDFPSSKKYFHSRELILADKNDLKKAQRKEEDARSACSGMRAGGWGWVSEGVEKVDEAAIRKHFPPSLDCAVFYILFGRACEEKLSNLNFRCWIRLSFVFALLSNVRSFCLQLIPQRRENEWVREKKKLGKNLSEELLP